MSAADSFHVDEKVTLTIEVTGPKDVDDLHVTLTTATDVTIDGPMGWEDNLSLAIVQPGYAGWNFAHTAGQTHTFHRVIHFPARQGSFFFSADVMDVGRAIVGTDNFYIAITEGVGKVIREGMPLPDLPRIIIVTPYGPGTPVPAGVQATEPWMAEVSKTPASPFSPYPAPSSSPYP